MTIEIISDRSPHKAASLQFLQAHIDYLSNPSHADHLNKVEIHPPKVYNLANPTAAGFLKAVTDADQAYIKFRSGKRGKRTDSIWDETVYRTPDKTDLNDGERSMVELTMLSIRPGNPAFMQWHYNIERESWDLHVLTPTKSTDWPPHVQLSATFGAGKKHVYAELERLDQDLVDSLNKHRPPGKKITSKLERKREKALAAIGEPPSLAQEIANSTKKPVSRANLVELVQALGHQVKRPPKGEARFLSVIFSGAKQTRRQNIPDLLHDVATIQQELNAHAKSPTHIRLKDGPDAPSFP